MKSKAAIHAVEAIIWVIWYNVASGGGTMNAVIAVPVIVVLISVFTEGSWTEQASKYALKTLKAKRAAHKAAKKAAAGGTPQGATPVAPEAQVAQFEPQPSSMN